MNQNVQSQRHTRRMLASLGLTGLLVLAACGGGGGEGGAANPSANLPTNPPTKPPVTAQDPRETSVTPATTIRWEGGGFDGISIADIRQASDGGLWVLGAEGGLSGRPFLRKIEGANPCGADGQRFISEIHGRFQPRQGPTSLSAVQDGHFYAAFVGPGTRLLARFDEATCAADTSFGDRGVMRIPLPALVTVTDVKLQRDSPGGVLVAVTIPGQMLMRRLTPEGVWDSSFGNAGLATSPDSDNFWLYSLAIAPNGDILAGGSVSIPMAFRPAILKFDAFGALVTSFGTGGVQRYPELSIGTGHVESLLIEGDRVLVGAVTAASIAVSDFVTSNSELAAIDLQSGQLKPDFGTRGFLRWDWGYSSYEATVGWLPNGRGGYVGCGHVLKSLLAGQPVSLVDVTASGQPDTTVGHQGRRLVAGTRNATCAGVARMTDGRLAVAANDSRQAVVMFFDR